MVDFPLDLDLCRALQQRLSGDLPTPEEEALALRELVEKSPLSLALTLKIWRELMGERRRISGAPAIAIAPFAPASMLNLAAHDYGGASAPYIGFDRPEAALNHTRTSGAPSVIGVSSKDAWWVRLLAEPVVRVTLSFGDPVAPLAFVVQPGRTGPTGADETYFVTDASLSAPKMVAVLGQKGLAAELVAETGGLKLIALAGYVQDEDERLAEVPGRLKGVIGSTPRYGA